MTQDPKELIKLNDGSAPNAVAPTKWAPDPALRRIVCAAVLIQWGSKSLKLVSPRHWDSTMHDQLQQIVVLAYPAAETSEAQFAAWVKANLDMEGQIQGFVDQFGDFWDRSDAYSIARRQHQIVRKTGNQDSWELFSEDLY